MFYCKPGETVKDFIDRCDVKLGETIVTNGKMDWEVSPQIGSSGWYLRSTSSDKAHIGKAAVLHVSIPNLHIQTRYLVKCKIDDYISTTITPELGKSLSQHWHDLTLSLDVDLTPADRSSPLSREKILTSITLPHSP